MKAALLMQMLSEMSPETQVVICLPEDEEYVRCIAVAQKVEVDEYEHYLVLIAHPED